MLTGLQQLTEIFKDRMAWTSTPAYVKDQRAEAAAQALASQIIAESWDNVRPTLEPVAILCDEVAQWHRGLADKGEMQASHHFAMAEQLEKMGRTVRRL